jgi:hypothetical protein
LKHLQNVRNCVIARKYDEDIDKRFVYNSFLQSAKRSEAFKEIPLSFFNALFSKKINTLLNNFNCLVACNPQEPEQVYGYIIYDTDTVFYVYVKHHWRQKSIASFLFIEAFGEKEEYELNYPIRTHGERKFKKLEQLKLTYNPLLL